MAPALVQSEFQSPLVGFLKSESSFYFQKRIRCEYVFVLGEHGRELECTNGDCMKLQLSL